MIEVGKIKQNLTRRVIEFTFSMYEWGVPTLPFEGQPQSARDPDSFGIAPRLGEVNGPTGVDITMAITSTWETKHLRTSYNYGLLWIYIYI